MTKWQKFLGLFSLGIGLVLFVAAQLGARDKADPTIALVVAGFVISALACEYLQRCGELAETKKQLAQGAALIQQLENFKKDMSEFIDRFLTQEDVDRLLSRLAVGFNDACMKQTLFHQAVQVAPVHASEVEQVAENMGRKFEEVRNRVAECKDAFWSAHNIVSKIKIYWPLSYWVSIRNTTMRMEHDVTPLTLREGAGHKAYLPSPDGALDYKGSPHHVKKL